MRDTGAASPPVTTAAAAPDQARPSTSRPVYREPPARRRRQVSLKAILDADPGPPDGDLMLPLGIPPLPERRGKRRR